MNVGLILTTPLAVQVHVTKVLPAFMTGTWLILFSRKGTKPHRILGALTFALGRLMHRLFFG